MANDREAKVVLVADTDQYNRKLEEASKSTSKFGAALDKVSKTTESITKNTSKGLLKIGTAEIASLTALSAVAGQLEKQTSNIQANFAINKTSSVFQEVTKGIRELSRQIPMSRAEIAGLTEDMSNLGFTSAKQIKAATEQFAKMGVATGESPQVLASSMIQFSRAMGMSPTPDSMEPYNNAATYLSARAGVTATGVLGFASQIAPAARVAGLEMPSVLGISALAERTGTEGAFASSTISQILNDITKLRYTKDPEMRRYATALNIPLGELLGDVAPEEEDKFNRNIISKILEVSQSEEGPSRLQLLGFEGLRAKKALQGLSSQPGGVEAMINAAQIGMTSNAVQTGFEEASGGMYDQFAKLRNKATDVGQGIGEPVMNSVTVFADKLNRAADVVGRLLRPFESLVAKIGGLVSTVTLFGGAMLAVWKTISMLTMLQRGLNNVGTSSFLTGMRVGQARVRGDDTSTPINKMDEAQREGRVSGFQRVAYNLGGGVGSMFPNAATLSPWQRFLQSADRARHLITTGVVDHYRKAAMEAPDRYTERLRQQAMWREVRPAGASEYMPMTTAQARLAAQRWEEIQKTRPAEIRTWERQNQQNAAAQARGREAPYPALGPRPNDLPSYFRPWSGPESGRMTLTGLVRNVARDWAVTTPMEALRSVPGQLRQVGPVIGAGIGAGVRDLTGGLFGTRAPEELGRFGRIGAMAGSVMNPYMLGTMALMYGGSQMYSSYKAQQEENKRWEKGGEGFGAEIFSNINSYNEKLGLATESLQTFSNVLEDISNPAKTENVKAELMNDKNVFDVGRQADYKMYNERIKTFTGSLESAQEYLSQFGDLNADQVVAIFRDLSSVMDYSEVSKLREWWLTREEGRQGEGKEFKNPEISFDAMAEELNRSNAEQRSTWAKIAGNLFGTATRFGIGGQSTEQTKQAASDFTATISQYAKTIAESSDASMFKTGTDTEKAAALQKVIQVGKGIEGLEELRGVWERKSGTGPNGRPDRAGEAAARSTWEEVRNRLAGDLGVELQDVNIWEGTGEEIRKRIFDAIKKQADEGQTAAKMIIESGIIGGNFESFNGKDLDTWISGLGGKQVTTTIDQMIKGSWFKSAPEDSVEKYFGKGTALSGMKVGITDPMEALAASFSLLNFAQDHYGDSVAETDMALQSFKTTLSQNDVNMGVITGAQQLLQLQTGQFEIAGGGPSGWARNFEARSGFLQTMASDTEQPVETAGQVVELLQEGTGLITEWYAKTREFEKSRERAEEDFNLSMSYNREDFQRQQLYSEEDFYRARAQNSAAFERNIARQEASFHRQTERSKASFYRNQQHSEEAFHRQLKYQQQDFDRSRLREEEAHARQMARMAEDTAKSIADPFNRMQLQLLSDPQALLSNMGNRAEIAETMTRDIDTLRNRGLSEQAMQQLNMFDFNNSQQTHHLANTISDEDIRRFNEMAETMVGLGGRISREDTGVKRSEEDRSIALAHAMEDFIRQLKRTKIEHSIQVKWSEKEFKISLKESEKEFQISIAAAREEFEISNQIAEENYNRAMNRANDAFIRAETRSMEAFNKSMKRQADDLTMYFDTYATTQKDMVNKIKSVLGTVASEGAENIIKMIDTADREVKSLWALLVKLANDIDNLTKGKRTNLPAGYGNWNLDANGNPYTPQTQPNPRGSRSSGRTNYPASVTGGGGTDQDASERKTGLPGLMQSWEDRVHEWAMKKIAAAFPTPDNPFGEGDDHIDMGKIGKGHWLSKAIGGRINPPPNGWRTRIHPKTGRRSFHYGVDVGRPWGSPLYAPFDGVAAYFPSGGPNGNYMVIKGDDHGYAVSYSHLSGSHKTGRVSAGDKVAAVGSTGLSTGPHLHIEVLRPPYKIDASAINPYPFLAKGGIVTKETMANMGEGGKPEAVIPLDLNGAKFMATFASTVARELGRTMPRTAAQSTVTSAHYDHSTNMNVENVTVQTQDPKRFLQELKAEAGKKRAALYKGEYTGVRP